MSYTTAEILWPDRPQINQHVKTLIQRTLSLLDDTSGEAGLRMADQVYTEDAVVVFSTGEHKGREAIIHSRDAAWDAVTSRRHIFEKLYTHDESARDLMAFGRVEVALRNGKALVAPFAARLLVDANSLDAGDPRLTEFRGYVDTSPILLALQK